MYKYDAWYLYGYCRERKDYRAFKLPRIAELIATTEYFQRHVNVPSNVRVYDQKKRDQQAEAVLHFSVGSMAKAMDFFYNAKKSFHEDGSLTLTVNMNNTEIDWLLPILLSFGDGVEVLEPPELRQAVKTKLEKMLKRYS
ncbi:hypothetical protein D3C73_853990 [compost metagenome]